MRTNLTIFGLLAVILFSCTKVNEQELALDAECQKLGDLDSIKFAEHVMPIITVNCLSCHNNTDAQGGITLETHADVNFLALDGILLTAIKHESGAAAMPQGDDKLPQCYIDAIQKWTDQGALDN